jgi:glycosyltransferase involved in cell wall biosynthesis
MALGMVPLIVDYGGPGEIVTAKTGFKIPIGTKRAITDHARAKLEEIAANRHDLKQMAKDGRQRIEALYTWERKAQQISEVYEWVSGTRDRPRFSFLSN